MKNAIQFVVALSFCFCLGMTFTADPFSSEAEAQIAPRAAGVVGIVHTEWGTCNVPPGSTCAGCNTLGAACGLLGNPVGGTNGCSANNPAIAVGTSCPGLFIGTCTFNSHFCGFPRTVACKPGPGGIGWVPFCAANPNPLVGCPGC